MKLITLIVACLYTGGWVYGYCLLEEKTFKTKKIIKAALYILYYGAFCLVSFCILRYGGLYLILN